MRFIFTADRKTKPAIRPKVRFTPSIKRTVELPVTGKLRAPTILDATHHDASCQLDLNTVVLRVVALAQTLAEKKFYPYQVELTYRIVESLLLHDGEVVTALMSRQMGKSESVGAIAAAIAVIFPYLARKFPKDWKFNLTDENGSYRGYSFGIKIGIYAPKQEQSGMLFDRVKKAYSTDTGKKVLKELGLSFDVRNGNTCRLSNGSTVLCESASEQSKIEGATHHLLIAEESQEISDLKMRKSLHPMVAATQGTIVKIGTATTYVCDFYNAIKANERMELVTGQRNHFYFPWEIGARFNSLYRNYIEKEKARIGEESDEFQTSYAGKWIFERGMFLTQELLFNTVVAQVTGIWSTTYDFLPRGLHNCSIVAGIDWGSSSDSTVVTLMAVDWSNPFESGVSFANDESGTYTYYNKHVIGWVEFLGDNYEYQFNEIVGMLSRIPQLRKVVTDSNTCGKPIFDRLASVFSGSKVLIEPFNFQPRIKSDGYKALYADLCASRITFPASPETRRKREYQKFIAQLLDLRKEYRQGIMSIAHPAEKGAHDDYPDSLMLANWGANSPSSAGRLALAANNPFYN